MLLTRKQVRDLDRRAIEEFGVPALVLMENAGRGAAELLSRLGVQGNVALCCGKGNNGGDGLVMARHLQNLGVKPVVHLFAGPDSLSAEAAVHWNIIQKAEIPARVWEDGSDPLLASALAGAAWVVDALFGTGLSGPVRAPFDRVIAAINASTARVFALDIPSGLDADSGTTPGPTVRAHYTATFVARKKGFDNPSAREWLGEVHVIDIGVPLRLLHETAAVP